MSARLLSSGDPAPFHVRNPDGKAPFILTCEHAGKAFPEKLGALGIAPEDIETHWVYDIGAGDVARRLSDILDAPAIIGSYSRAIVDLNRAPDQPGLFVVEGEGRPIPGNENLSDADCQVRMVELYESYHAELARMIAARTEGDRVPALVSIHSFTPKFYNQKRPWEVGILWAQDSRIAMPLIEFYRAQGVPTGDNEPYDARIFRGSSVNRHGDRDGLPNVLIEFRNDTISTADGAQRAAELCAQGLTKIFSDPALFTRYAGEQIPYDPEAEKIYLENLLKAARQGDNAHG